jgi:MFS family permease
MMRDWFRFIADNKRLLNFGYQFNFFSSFGQTFFISLYVPFLVESLKISNAGFGSLYATVTVISAFLLSVTGKYIDSIPLKKFAALVFAGIVMAVVILSQAYNVALLAISLFLVRWLGQGMMTHTSSTGIAKHFEVNRGKALAFTALGHPVGQFLLPLITLPLISETNWRMSLILLTLAAAVIVIPSIWAIAPVTKVRKAKTTVTASDIGSINYFASLKFWIIAANIFVVPFLCTAVFLYQFTIGQSKGWDATWVAFSFAFYAVFNAVSLLASGNLVDRFSGVKLFPLYLLPTLLALVLMAFVDNKWVYPIFYALLGISSGLGSTIKTAMQVEIYGTGNLGKIRSYFSTLLVLSTALGPPVFGFFIDKHYSFNTVMVIFAILTLLILVLSFRIKKYSSAVTRNLS